MGCGNLLKFAAVAFISFFDIAHLHPITPHFSESQISNGLLDYTDCFHFILHPICAKFLVRETGCGDLLEFAAVAYISVFYIANLHPIYTPFTPHMPEPQINRDFPDY